MEKKDNILKKGLLKTNDEFTSKLMKHIDKEELALSNVLMEHGQVEAPEGFTVQLMEQLEGKRPQSDYTPVISRPVWMGIAAIFLAIVGLVVFNGSPSSGIPGYADYIEGTSSRIQDLIERVNILYYAAAGIFFVSIGLLSEQRLGKKS